MAAKGNFPSSVDRHVDVDDHTAFIRAFHIFAVQGLTVNFEGWSLEWP